MNKLLRLLLILTCCFISNTCFATVETGEQNYTNLKLQYPLVYLTDQQAQDKINTDIARYVYDFKGRYDNGEFYQGKMSYEIKYEDDKYLSLLLKGYIYNAGAAHGYSGIWGIVYDKNTGDRVPFQNFVPIKSAEFIERLINENIVNLYDSQMNRVNLYSRYGENHVKRMSNDFYISSDGSVYLLYQEYELGPYSYGATRIKFTPEAIDYIYRRYKIGNGNMWSPQTKQNSPNKVEDDIAKANDLLAKHDYSFPIVAISKVDDDGFLAFSKGDKYTGFIIYDKKTGTIASINYTSELLNLRANPVIFNDKKHYNPIHFTLNILNTTQGDTDTKLGEWQYSTHKIPIYAIFDIDENDNIIPQKFMTGEGLNPKKFDKTITELRNINLLDIVLTHSDSLKQDIKQRDIALP